MQKRYKSLTRLIILICFLLSMVSVLAVRHVTMMTASSVHATHSIASRTKNNSSSITFNWKQHTNNILEQAFTTWLGRNTSHTSSHPASTLGKNLKHAVVGSSVQPVNTPSEPGGSSVQPVNAPPVPGGQGKMILISITNQWMYMYQGGKQVADTPITTGRPGLDTPAGTFHVFEKLSPTTFYSMWPAGSANYFAPTHINFALEFLYPGYFIHDSLWRHVYGPGSNTSHLVSGYGTETGSHGCVNVPYAIMPWLYSWADINTTIQLSY